MCDVYIFVRKELFKVICFDENWCRVVDRGNIVDIMVVDCIKCVLYVKLFLMFYYCNVGFLIKVGGKIVYVCDKFVMNIGIIGYVDYGKIILIVVIIKILFEFN